jgi:hypothetical protein
MSTIEHTTPSLRLMNSRTSLPIAYEKTGLKAGAVT